MIEFSQNFKDDINLESQDNLFSKISFEKESSISGYYNLPYCTKAVLESDKYLQFNKSIISELSHMVIIGIGGSSLGLKAIDTMLYHLPNRKNISLKFLEHTDPLKIQKSLKKIKLQSTLFIVISKSGNTVETISLMKYAINRYDLTDNALKKRLLIITDSNSPLDIWGKHNNIYSITIDKNIGGRFCALSAVGIVPLRILGYKVHNILKGARHFSDNFFNRREDHLLKKALFLAKNRDIYKMNILFSYSSSFTDFNSWYVQLWGESLGKVNKNGVKVGLTPISLIGSIDQHSFLQLILQGRADKSVTFLSINENKYTSLSIPDIQIEGLESTNFVNNLSFAKLLDYQKRSTLIALNNENIPTDSIKINSLSEKNIGALIMYYELLTSAVGCIFEINTYDQPAVEFGKKILRDLLG